MSAALPAKRAQRGRVLVVDDLPLAERLHGALPRTVDYVANLYEAVGEIATASARSPVEAVIVPARGLTRPPDVVAEVLRRTDRSVQLFLVLESQPTDDGASMIESGFDGVLIAPVSAAMVSEALDGDEAFAMAPDSGAALREPAGEKQAAPVRSAEEVVTRRPQPPPFELPDQLGDSDLVRIVIEHPEHLAEAAMALLRQETGWDDARFITEPGDRPDESSMAVVPVRYDGHDFGWLCAPKRSTGQVAPWASWLACWLALGRAHVDLQRDAYTDPLTGAWNRRYFDEFLPEALADARRRRRPVTLMVFDVDDLKKYNDTYGHEAGDIVLTETVRLLKSIVRRGDMVFRIGGDEFVVVFAHIEAPRRPGSTPLESIDDIARRFQAEICKMRFPKLGIEAPGTLSISAGMATFPWDGNDAPTLLRVADELALESKRRGKNALTIGPGAAKLCGRATS